MYIKGTKIPPRKPLQARTLTPPFLVYIKRLITPTQTGYNQPVSHNPYTRCWDKQKGKTYYLHRAVAERKLGRPLEPGEVVHHLNGDKQDNHPDNIPIFCNHRAHMLYENYYRREAKGVHHLFSVEEYLATLGLSVH